MHIPRVRIALFGAVLATLAVTAIGRITPAETPARSNAEPLAPGTAALRAQLDPETGTWTDGHLPAQKIEDPELQNALSRSTEGLVEVVHPDGSVSVNLQGRFQSASVVRIAEDGTLQRQCVADHDHAKHFLNDAAPALEVR